MAAQGVEIQKSMVPLATTEEETSEVGEFAPSSRGSCLRHLARGLPLVLVISLTYLGVSYVAHPYGKSGYVFRKAALGETVKEESPVDPPSGVKVCLDTEGNWKMELVGKPATDLVLKVKEEIQKEQLEPASAPTAVESVRKEEQQKTEEDKRMADKKTQELLHEAMKKAKLIKQDGDKKQQDAEKVVDRKLGKKLDAPEGGQTFCSMVTALENVEEVIQSLKEARKTYEEKREVEVGLQEELKRSAVIKADDTEKQKVDGKKGIRAKHKERLEEEAKRQAKKAAEEAIRQAKKVAEEKGKIAEEKVAQAETAIKPKNKQQGKEKKQQKKSSSGPEIVSAEAR